MKKINKYSVISAEESREKNKVIFEFVLDDGSILGPFVEHRPAGEDHDAFVAGMIAALEESMNAPKKTREEELMDDLKGYPDEVIKSALRIDDAKVAELRVDREALSVDRITR